MSILGHKDADLLELVRAYAEEDHGFFSVLYRPLEDLNQRTVDLNTIMYPALGLRVRQEVAASKTVVICGGSLADDATYPVEFPEIAVADTLTIPDCAAGQVRVDLIYLDLLTRTIQRAIGAEVPPDAVPPSAHTYVTAWPGRGTVLDLTTSGILPLAYVFVDDVLATVYDETTAAYTPGAILDVRSPPGTGRLRFGTTVGQLYSSTPGGNLGLLPAVPRADHVHPARADATVPQAETADSVGSYGNPANPYARADHTHNMVAGIKAAGPYTADITIPTVGADNTIMRADHRHSLNVSANLPQPAQPGVPGSVGVSPYYSRSDHRHAVLGVRLQCISGEHTWTASAEDHVIAVPFVPIFMIVLGSGSEAVDWDGSGWYSTGVYSSGTSTGGAVSYRTWNNQTADETSVGYDISGGVAGAAANGGGLLTTYIKWTVVTFSKAAGITLRPSAAPTRAALQVYIFGQEL
jgi:hypothetical protein